MMRPAVHGDLESCAAIIADSLLWECYERSLDDALAFFTAEFENGSDIWIEERNGECVAYLVLIEKGMMGEFPFIRALGVRRDFRRSGVATMFLDFATERMFRLKPKLFLMVSDFNEAAQKLYYSYGFEKVGEVPDYKKKGIGEFIMLKRDE